MQCYKTRFHVAIIFKCNKVAQRPHKIPNYRFGYHLFSVYKLYVQEFEKQ